MVITRIEEESKSRSRIWIDGEFAFVLYKGELRQYHLKEGEELTEENRDLIMKEVLPKRAKLRAMNLLLKRDYTTAQLREKLMAGGYPPEITEQALDYVASYHYTDDLRYAEEFIRCHQESKSRLRIIQDLKRKGIEIDTIEQAFAHWEEQGGNVNEEEMIRALLRKRGFSPENASVAQQQKEFAFLMRKGFQAELVKRMVCGRL